MWDTRVIYIRFAIFCLLIAAVPDLVLGLRDVSVTVPTAVRKGDNALLICNYDMEGDNLYSVKWYKGRREFYRYTPKENPAMKIFSAPGINVERSLSNQSHVVLLSVQLNNTGKFSCEVSADAPSFHTVIVSGDMEVVEIPEQRPLLTGIHSRYRIGDTINGNCTSYYSKPAANLTWAINDIPAMPHQLRNYPILKNLGDNLETSVLELSVLVTPQHFIRGRLKLKCIARIHGIYEMDSEKSIEEDRPRILASGRSPDMNLFPYDQQSDGELSEQNELYLTHYKEDLSSSASSALLMQRNRRYKQNIFHTSRQLYKIIKFEIFNFDKIFYITIFILFTIANNYNNHEIYQILTNLINSAKRVYNWNHKIQQNDQNNNCSNNNNNNNNQQKLLIKIDKCQKDIVQNNNSVSLTFSNNNNNNINKDKDNQITRTFIRTRRSKIISNIDESRTNNRFS